MYTKNKVIEFVYSFELLGTSFMKTITKLDLKKRSFLGSFGRPGKQRLQLYKYYYSYFLIIFTYLSIELCSLRIFSDNIP